VLRRYGPALFLAGVRTRDLRCLDASLPLFFPNPSLGINLTVLGLGTSTGMGFATGDFTLAVGYATLASAQFVMFMVGVMHTEDKLASALSLFLAPAFLVWKLGIDVLSLAGAGTRHWKQTERKVL
jgi:hypothetical protein